MQSLDVISVNLWSILISIANLLIIFVILKRFLYKPLKKVLEARRAAVDEVYAAAEVAKSAAEEDRAAWNEKMATARDEADAILKTAEENASRRGDAIVSEAQQKAEGILRVAESEAELARKKAAAGLRKDLVDVSSALAEKLLDREINAHDHRALIDSFISEVEEAHGGTE